MSCIISHQGTFDISTENRYEGMMLTQGCRNHKNLYGSHGEKFSKATFFVRPYFDGDRRRPFENTAKNTTAIHIDRNILSKNSGARR